MSSNKADKWGVAINSELSSLKDNDTFEIVPASRVSAGAKVLDSRWVLTEKIGADGAIKEKAAGRSRGSTA